MTPSSDVGAEQRVLLAGGLLQAATREMRVLAATRGRSWRTARRIAKVTAAAALALSLLAAPAPALTPEFVSPFLIPHGGGRPAVADIDRDGDLDALFGESGGDTLFFENTGTAKEPAFAAPATNPFGLANVGSSSSPELADIDGDGDLDALIGNDSGDVVFFENTGTAAEPAFAAPSTNPFGLANVGRFSNPAFADIDGDGDLDALIGESGGDTIFFENTGTAAEPAFAAPSTNPFGLANVGFHGSCDSAFCDRGCVCDDFGFDSSPDFADIDGDGDLDALIGEFYGNTIFFENTGSSSSPAFAAPSTGPFGLVNNGLFDAFHIGRFSRPELADIDDDGDLDALIGTLFFENTGTATEPTFAAPSANPLGLANVGSLSSPELADIDGDGDLDALIGNSHGNTIFFENTGTSSSPAFAAPSTNPFGLANVGRFSNPAFADIDGDGDLDAFGNNAGGVVFLENTGTATEPAFAAPSTNPFGLADVGGGSPAFADIDGDGDLDALIGKYDGNTVFFVNTGTAAEPAFAAPSTNPFGLADVGYSSSPELADIDGDGDLDALIGEYYGYTLFFENTGSSSSPAFAAPSTNPFGLGHVSLHSSPELADIDGDGDLDAFIGTARGDVFFFENVAISGGAACVGDCDRNGQVGIDELTLGVAIALGNTDADRCSAMDQNGDQRVAVHELVAAVRAALDGCPAARDP